jgi:hypothetical protein
VASAGRFSDDSGSVFLYNVSVEAPLIDADAYLQHKAAVVDSVRESSLASRRLSNMCASDAILLSLTKGRVGDPLEAQFARR